MQIDLDPLTPPLHPRKTALPAVTHRYMQLLAPHRHVLHIFHATCVTEAASFNALGYIMSDLMLVVKKGSKVLKPRFLCRIEALLMDDDVADAIAEGEVRGIVQ